MEEAHSPHFMDINIDMSLTTNSQLSPPPAAAAPAASCSVVATKVKASSQQPPSMSLLSAVLSTPLPPRGNRSMKNRLSLSRRRQRLAAVVAASSSITEVEGRRERRQSSDSDDNKDDTSQTNGNNADKGTQMSTKMVIMTKGKGPNDCNDDDRRMMEPSSNCEKEGETAANRTNVITEKQNEEKEANNDTRNHHSNYQIGFSHGSSREMKTSDPLIRVSKNDHDYVNDPIPPRTTKSECIKHDSMESSSLSKPTTAVHDVDDNPIHPRGRNSNISKGCDRMKRTTSSYVSTKLQKYRSRDSSWEENSNADESTSCIQRKNVKRSKRSDDVDDSPSFRRKKPTDFSSNNASSRKESSFSRDFFGKELKNNDDDSIVDFIVPDLEFSSSSSSSFSSSSDDDDGDTNDNSCCSDEEPKSHSNIDGYSTLQQPRNPGKSTRDTDSPNRIMPRRFEEYNNTNNKRGNGMAKDRHGDVVNTKGHDSRQKIRHNKVLPEYSLVRQEGNRYAGKAHRDELRSKHGGAESTPFSPSDDEEDDDDDDDEILLQASVFKARRPSSTLSLYHHYRKRRVILDEDDDDDEEDDDYRDLCNEKQDKSPSCVGKRKYPGGGSNRDAVIVNLCDNDSNDDGHDGDNGNYDTVDSSDDELIRRARKSIQSTMREFCDSPGAFNQNEKRSKETNASAGGKSPSHSIDQSTRAEDCTSPTTSMKRALAAATASSTMVFEGLRSQPRSPAFNQASRSFCLPFSSGAKTIHSSSNPLRRFGLDCEIDDGEGVSKDVSTATAGDDEIVDYSSSEDCNGSVSHNRRFMRRTNSTFATSRSSTHKTDGTVSSSFSPISRLATFAPASPAWHSQQHSEEPQLSAHHADKEKQQERSKCNETLQREVSSIFLAKKNSKMRGNSLSSMDPLSGSKSHIALPSRWGEQTDRRRKLRDATNTSYAAAVLTTNRIREKRSTNDADYLAAISADPGPNAVNLESNSSRVIFDVDANVNENPSTDRVDVRHSSLGMRNGALSASYSSDFIQMGGRNNDTWYRHPNHSHSAAASGTYASQTQRNDISGGSGVGVGGYTLNGGSLNDDDDDNVADEFRGSLGTASSRTRRTGSTGAISSRKKRKSSTSTSSKTPAKRNAGGNRKWGRGRRRYYRKKASRGTVARKRNGGASSGPPSRSHRNEWSSRERGIGAYHRTGATESYMDISRQDPQLSNVGGANITFH